MLPTLPEGINFTFFQTNWQNPFVSHTVSVDELAQLLASPDCNELFSKSLEHPPLKSLVDALSAELMNWSGQGELVVRNNENGTGYTYTFSVERHNGADRLAIKKSTHPKEKTAYVEGVSLSTLKCDVITRKVQLGEIGFEHAYSLLRQEAEKGNAKAQFHCGIMICNGLVRGKKEDFLAEDMFDKAAQQDHFPAKNKQFLIALLDSKQYAGSRPDGYFTDFVNAVCEQAPSNEDAGKFLIENIKPLARAGYAPAQYVLGMLSGRFSHWDLEAAAKQEFVPALHECGMRALFAGDDKLALNYFNQAAKWNYPASVYRLGELKLKQAEKLLSEANQPENQHKEERKVSLMQQYRQALNDALGYFLPAANSGYAKAQYKMGLQALFSGKLESAQKWFSLAAARHSPSCFELIRIDYFRKNWSDLTTEEQKACMKRLDLLVKRGYVPAIHLLAKIKIKAGDDEGVWLLYKAIEGGDQIAQQLLIDQIKELRAYNKRQNVYEGWNLEPTQDIGWSRFSPAVATALTDVFDLIEKRVCKEKVQRQGVCYMYVAIMMDEEQLGFTKRRQIDGLLDKLASNNYANAKQLQEQKSTKKAHLPSPNSSYNESGSEPLYYVQWGDDSLLGKIPLDVFSLMRRYSEGELLSPFWSDVKYNWDDGRKETYEASEIIEALFKESCWHSEKEPTLNLGLLQLADWSLPGLGMKSTSS